MKFALAVVVVLLALFVFQRVVAPSTEAKIGRTIKAVATTTDPASCTTRMTPRYLEQITGARAPYSDEVCEGQTTAESRADSVETSEVEIEGDYATAAVAYAGGSFDGSKLIVRLREEDGRWKLDRIAGFESFDRSGFDRAYRQSLVEFELSKSGVECALDKSRSLSNAEIERATVTDLPRVFTAFFVACDRAGAERNLVDAFAEPRLGLPPAAIRCFANRVEALPDTGLARLHLNPQAYGELVYRCGGGAIYDYVESELRADQGLDPKAIECVANAIRARPVSRAVRLSYDQAGFAALVERCE